MLLVADAAPADFPWSQLIGSGSAAALIGALFVFVLTRVLNAFKEGMATYASSLKDMREADSTARREDRAAEAARQQQLLEFLKEMLTRKAA